MSEAIDNNVEVQEEEFFVEEIDLEAIGKRFESESVFTRIKLLLRGLKAPAGSREYKEALIELQRLLAPVGAIIIPLIFIAILFVCSVPEKTNKDLRNINVAKAEEEASLEEPPPEMEDLTETTTDLSISCVSASYFLPSMQYKFLGLRISIP